MIWFVSNTHFHHRNIVRGCSQWSDLSGCRDFDTLDQHDQWLVNLINAKVGRQDTLWHLGDWSFGGKDQIQTFRDQINCEKVHIVLGNHDHHIDRSNLGRLQVFESVLHYKELQVGGLQIVLCHYPIESWNNMERGSVHLHGHVHGRGSFIQGRVDVGVDARGLISLDEVAALPKASTQRHPTIEGGNRFAGTN